MVPQTPNFEAVLERLEKLERQNRRLKQVALAAFVAATALVTIYASQPVPQKIMAHEFDVIDNSGRVRAELGMFADRPTLTLHDTRGFPVASLAGGDDPFLTLNRAGYHAEQVELLVSKDHFGLALYGKTIKAGLAVTKGSPALSLFDEAGKERGVLQLSEGAQPNLSLSDDEGFETSIGSTGLVTPSTGETHKTSAASIVMIDKEKNVIWRAP